ESEQRAVGSLHVATQRPACAAGFAIDVDGAEGQQPHAEDVERAGVRVPRRRAAQKTLALMAQIYVIGFDREGRNRPEPHDGLPGVIVDLEAVAGGAENVVDLRPDITGTDIEAGIGRR